MPNWLKFLFGLFIVLFISAVILRRIYLTPSYVKKPVLESKIQQSTIQNGGHDRDFLWYAPKNITTKSIVFVLHGSTGTGEGVREQTAYEFDQLADKEGFVVVYPTGYFNHWNDCRGSADYKANIDNIDDISFLKAIEKYIAKALNLSFDYRFSTGHSNGGHFSFKLALEAPDWITAIAPISANLPVDSNLDCLKKGVFVPILLINGTADRVNPYNGGLVSILGNDSRGTVLSTDETMAYWLALGNCEQNPIIKRKNKLSKSDKSYVEESIWKCDSIPQAVLFKVEGGGHTIPHTKSKMPKILGVTNHDINASVEIWHFFKQQMR